MQWSARLRWMLCYIAGFATFSVAFISSSYSSGVAQIAHGPSKVYVSMNDKPDSRSKSVCLPPILSRPFQLVVQDPVILLLALYQAIVFGTLYLTFAAFPILYGPTRGWSPGMSGLSFLGLIVGTLCSVVFQLWENRQYVRLVERMDPEQAPPEARLPGCCIGSVSLVVGLFWFTLTSTPDIHWAWSISSGVPFEFGVVLITIGSTNYLVDPYTVFAASALTICICARAACGALAPLLVRRAFEKFDVQWALTIPASLALVCAPFPFVLYHQGTWIRATSKSAHLFKSIRSRLWHSPAEITPLLVEGNDN
ncbi:unnamed protein product [Penicillium glandicola]